MWIGRHNLDQRVLVVAEAGNNHEGSFARAEEMVGRAAESGADAIKFQTIVPEKLVAASEGPRLAQLARFQFSYAQFASLAKTAAGAGITFLSTPFDADSAAALEPLVPAYKIASGDNDCYPLLQCVAQAGKPILLSTGMLDLDGVARAKSSIEAVWRQRAIDPGLVLLHCVVAYPTPAAEANLGAIRALAGLGCRVGYSDHTLGNESAVLSIALGARVIEKHFTLDKNLSEFRDHKLSADPGEFADLVRRVRAGEEMLGTGVKRVMAAEEASLLAARRSIVAARDLAPGTVIALADLTWLRPRRGLSPGREGELIGRRLAAAVRCGEAILPEQLG
jgi:N-acetylneuraminate synthase/N,N'-diacetyllegionaminate synthase